MIPYMALCCSALLLSIYPGTAQASTLSWVAVVLVAGSGSKWHTQLAGDIHTSTVQPWALTTRKSVRGSSLKLWSRATETCMSHYKTTMHSEPL